MIKDNYPAVDVLVVHKNGEKILNECLQSLQKTRYPNFRTRVLLNGTTDNSEEVVKKYKVDIEKSEINLGFAGGTNLLIKKTKSKYIALINNDVKVDKDWLAELVMFAENNSADICQPKILSLKNKKKFEYAGAGGGYIDVFGFPFCRGRIFNTVEEDNGQYDTNARIFWACGSCMLIRRDILKKTGLLDEDFFMYAEEIDLCWRVNLIGGKIFNVYTSKIYHLGGYSVKKEKISRQKEFFIHRNTFLIFLKNYSPFAIAILLIPKICLEIISTIAFPGKILPVFKSFRWVLSHARQLRMKNKDVQSMRKINDAVIIELMYKRPITFDYFVMGMKRFSDLPVSHD